MVSSLPTPLQTCNYRVRPRPNSASCRSTKCAVFAKLSSPATAVFTGIMAKRTHDLATETCSMAHATEAMAKETKRAAETTVQEAAATEALVAEAQLDRQVSRSPVLARVRFHGTRSWSRWGVGDPAIRHILRSYML
jgi:hypothetical protein